MGLGAYPASDKKYLGHAGHASAPWKRNNTMQHCDVLLALGARFDDRVIGNPKHFQAADRKIIHVDVRSLRHRQAREGGHPHRW